MLTRPPRSSHGPQGLPETVLVIQSVLGTQFQSNQRRQGFLNCGKNSPVRITAYFWHVLFLRGLPQWLTGKESTCSAGDSGDNGFDSWVRKIPGGGTGKLLQYTCLECAVDRGAWWATVRRVARVRTQLRGSAAAAAAAC